MYGWAGADLEIDLSKGKIEKKEGNLKLNETYLGGRGIGSRIFWDRVPPEVSPFSPDNLLIIGTGALTGTPAPSANRTILTTKSPSTNFQTYSSMGGYWGPELKQAGYDTVIISGKSPVPVYIWINNDQVELRDASHLWGRDIRETQKLIREELRNNKVHILCIGPAGENMVLMSSIEHSTGASFSRAGVGAVMGDKKIKAIAVYGTKDINIAKMSQLFELSEKIHRRSAKLRAFVDDWSHNRITGLVGHGAYGNVGETIHWPSVGDVHEKLLEQSRTRRPSCFSCQVSCKSTMRLPDGNYAFVKCQSWFAFLLACKIRDFSFNLQCYNLCEKYGLDSMSTALTIGFAIDLYEKGILTAKDTEGMILEYGKADIAFTLIRKIAHREGLGDILSRGCYEAARLIGRGAEDHVYHAKKLEILPYNLWMPYYAFCTAIAERADMTRIESSVPQHYFHKPREVKEELINEGFWPYPDAWQKYMWDDLDWSGGDWERNVKMISYDWDKNTIADCAGTCIFWTGFWPYSPLNVAEHVDLISCVTGMDIDEAGLMTIARRVTMLLKVYNVILGMDRRLDAIHHKWFQEPKEEEKYFRDMPNAPEKALDRNIFDKWLDEYYKDRGWNREGTPTKEELTRLGLDFARKELERRGIL